MTTNELLTVAGICLIALWTISLVWFFVALAYDMLKQQDKDYD